MQRRSDLVFLRLALVRHLYGYGWGQSVIQRFGRGGVQPGVPGGGAQLVVANASPVTQHADGGVRLGGGPPAVQDEDAHGGLEWQEGREGGERGGVDVPPVYGRY